VYCYFERGSEIKWAIHPLGPPFRGKPDLFGFDPTPRLTNVECNEDLKDGLKEAVVRRLAARYHSQARFSEDSAVCEVDDDMETLELWEKSQLDISTPGTIEKIRQAVKAKFALDINEGRIELLTNLSLFSCSVFKTNDWQQILCQDSRPAVRNSTIDSLKRKAREESEEASNQSPSKKVATSGIELSTSTQSEILQNNLIISQWLRQELETVEPHFQTIQEFLKTAYGIEEEDASFDKIRKMTDTADPSMSPLQTGTFRGLAAAATTDLIPGLITPLGARPRYGSIRVHTPPVKTLCVTKAEDVD
jgi:hypothetical protein